MAKLSKMVGDKLWKLAEGKEIAILGIIATPESAAMIDTHMQDQYFCADRANSADVVFKFTP